MTNVLLTQQGLLSTRQAPIATTFNPGPDPHDGLATCVSLNTAVAARVGKHRVTYQPNLSGEPDPSGLQLRVRPDDAGLNRAGSRQRRAHHENGGPGGASRSPFRTNTSCP